VTGGKGRWHSKQYRRQQQHYDSHGVSLELQAVKQRNDHPGGGQDDQRGLVVGEVERGVHVGCAEVFAGADTRPAGRAALW
jgi:hypothetical protein